MDREVLKDVSHLQIDPKDYEIIQMIGNGSYGAVYLVKSKKNGGLYSMKYIQCQMMNHVQKQYLTREIEIMAKATHPALLSLRGFSFPKTDKSPVATIITDYMPKGTLFQLIQLEQQHAAPPEYNNTIKNIIIVGIAVGMKYLHSINIMHRDLKPENILLSESLEPHICDFGLSKLLDETTQNGPANTSSIGTPLYMAPEIFTNSPYDFKVDVYAFGMVLYEILTSLSPFKDITNPMALGMKICNGERPLFPPNFSPVFQVLIDRCWASNPDHRPTFDEIVEYLYNPQVFVEGADINKVNEYCQKINTKHKNYTNKDNENSDYSRLLQIIQSNSKTIESLKNEFQRATSQFNEETKRMQNEITELKKEESNVISGLKLSFQNNQELLKKLTEEHKNLMLEMQKLKRDANKIENSQQLTSHYSNPSFLTSNYSSPASTTYANNNNQQANILFQPQQQQQQFQLRQQNQQQKSFQYQSNNASSNAELNSVTNSNTPNTIGSISNFRNQAGSNPNLNQNNNSNLNYNLNPNVNQNQNMKQQSNSNLNQNANFPGYIRSYSNGSAPNFRNGNQQPT